MGNSSKRRALIAASQLSAAAKRAEANNDLERAKLLRAAALDAATYVNVGVWLSEETNEFQDYWHRRVEWRGGRESSTRFKAWVKAELERVEAQLEAFGLPPQCWRTAVVTFFIRDGREHGVIKSTPGPLLDFFRAHRGKRGRGKGFDAMLYSNQARALDWLIRSEPNVEIAFIAGRMYGSSRQTLAILEPDRASKRTGAFKAASKKREKHPEYQKAIDAYRKANPTATREAANIDVAAQMKVGVTTIARNTKWRGRVVG